MSDLSPLKKIIEKGLTLYVRDSPLINPPNKIVEAGNPAIIRFWTEQDRVVRKKLTKPASYSSSRRIGQNNFKDKLKDSKATMPEPDATTLGINIERIICKNTEGDDFTVQVWDFGGQNIQKYAHQFFMSDSVVYAVLSNTREQNPNFQYWLNIIELLGKESPFLLFKTKKTAMRSR